MFGGLTVYIFRLQISSSVICVKNYENWPAVDKVIAKITRLTFLAHPVVLTQLLHNNTTQIHIRTMHKTGITYNNNCYRKKQMKYVVSIIQKTVTPKIIGYFENFQTQMLLLTQCTHFKIRFGLKIYPTIQQQNLTMDVICSSHKKHH